MRTNHKYNSILIIAVVIYIAWVIGFSFYNYQNSKTELLANLDKNLELAARNYLNIIPGSLHHKNMSKNDLSKEEDRALLLRSNEYAKINKVHYLYSMIKVDNKVYFTMGNGTEEDMTELEGGGYYFYPYDEAEPHIFKSFEVQEPLFHDTQDHWGSFRSVFIPYISKDGTKFVVGADFTTGHIDKLLVKELVATFIISVLFLIFASPLLIAFTAQTRRWAKRLKLQTKKAVANEAKLSTLVKLAVDAIITIDDKGIVSAYNDAASRMFGYSVEEVLGKNVKMIMPESYKEKHDVFIQSYSETGKGKAVHNTIELIAQRKNGELFPIEISISEVIIGENEKLFSAIIRDLTDKKEKEKQLHDLVEKAEEANKAKSEFLAKMSHELRTPLHGIIALSHLGIEKADTDKIQDYFSNIEKSGERLKNLVDDLLDLSKLEVGKMQMSFKNQNIKSIIDDCITEQQGFLDECHLNISVTGTTDNPYAECDIDRISQVILNLLNNAIKFSPENTTIKFTISDAMEIDNKPVNALQVSISDQGKGVSEDRRESVFNKFAQVDTINNKFSGTGLGLAISREIIQAHNGCIWCQSSESGGAEFVFRMPVSNIY